MKAAIQYLNDQTGKTKAVQLPISYWTRLMNKLNKYEQMLKVKSDLTQAFEEVKKMRQGKIKKQSLQDFLDEL
ncbi:hypothetical protein [Terrimonas alba]|uniref:hypothetical protein n=1 Tax=Terrimonas alba TaxID=3349636 RepID=UPI0035F34E5B